MNTYRIIALAAFGSLALTGCSGENAAVQVRHVDAGGVTQDYEVRCPRPTPNMDITVECAELYTFGRAPEAGDPDRLCEPNEGADKDVIAFMQGTINGLAVSETFHRSDSCGIDRWERLAHVLNPEGKRGKTH